MGGAPLTPPGPLGLGSSAWVTASISTCGCSMLGWAAGPAGGQAPAALRGERNGPLPPSGWPDKVPPADLIPCGGIPSLRSGGASGGSNSLRGDSLPTVGGCLRRIQVPAGGFPPFGRVEPPADFHSLRGICWMFCLCSVTPFGYGGGRILCPPIPSPAPAPAPCLSLPYVLS